MSASVLYILKDTEQARKEVMLRCIAGACRFTYTPGAWWYTPYKKAPPILLAAPVGGHHSPPSPLLPTPPAASVGNMQLAASVGGHRLPVGAHHPLSPTADSTAAACGSSPLTAATLLPLPVPRLPVGAHCVPPPPQLLGACGILGRIHALQQTQCSKVIVGGP